jgi:hypothetical protein
MQAHAGARSKDCDRRFCHQKNSEIIFELGFAVGSPLGNGGKTCRFGQKLPGWKRDRVIGLKSVPAAVAVNCSGSL